MTTDAITLIQLSDCHVPGDRSARPRGVDTDATLAAVLDHARGIHGVDAILATGDLANEGSPAAYRRIRGLFRKVGLPILCLPGNHDAVDAFERELVGENISALGARCFGGWQIVLLDSTVAEWEDGRLDAAELDRLDGALKRFPDKHALICLHHHPVPVGGAWRDHVALRDADDFFRVTDRYRHVRAVIWGHIHQPFEGARDGVRLCGAPSTGFQFRPGRDGIDSSDDPPGYHLLRLSADGSIESEVIFLPRIVGGNI